MKYIATTTEEGTEEIFLFPSSVDHDAMAEVLGMIKNHTFDPWHRVMREPVSAGFVDQKGNCFGESITLNLKSRKDDTLLLALQT